MNCPACKCYCPPRSAVCPCGYVFVQAEEKSAPFSVAEKIRAIIRTGNFTRWALRGALILSAILAIAAFFFRDRLPDPAAILPDLLAEPSQTAEGVPEPFTVSVEKLSYEVIPLYAYELSGLVVSEHRSDSWLDIMHRRSKDRLNIKDLCMIWGENVRSGVYRQARFWNRDFTCFCRISAAEAAVRFSEAQLSNNHLLTADPRLRELIRGVRSGDQVRFKGLLARYRLLPDGIFRNTSTTRSDRGNGACETIFVNQFSILRRANQFWRAAFPLFLILSGVLVFAMLLI